MVFMALNHGASGILFFSYKSGDRPITQQRGPVPGGRTAGRRDQRAARARCSCRRRRRTSMCRCVEEHVPAAAPKASEDRAPLDCSLRPFLDAQLFIAVNPDSWKKTARLSMPSSVAGKSMEELFLDPPAQPLTVPVSHPLEHHLRAIPDAHILDSLNLPGVATWDVRYSGLRRAERFAFHDRVGRLPRPTQPLTYLPVCTAGCDVSISATWNQVPRRSALASCLLYAKCHVAGFGNGVTSAWVPPSQA